MYYSDSDEVVVVYMCLSFGHRADHIADKNLHYAHNESRQ